MAAKRQLLIPPFLIFLLLIPFSLSVSGQEILPDSFKFGWAGGLNSPQFNAIDLNLDGIKDLLIFDRHGNRKLTFINQGTPNTIDYNYRPEYASELPDLHDWVICADYNCDGKEDIFTYSNGGIRVYKNISVTSLQFEKITDMLESYYYSGFVGILVTPVDYPAIADIDGDGDLDLLSFFGLGSYVEYHKNLSMEKSGTCDSLDFRLSDHCWGRFKESEGGNQITLNAVCPYKDNQGSPLSRHTGSTMLATDLNGDGLKDLILGDIDFPNLIALINGGTPDTALMVSIDTVFPSNTQPVKLFSFPSASLLDLDNDGILDLVVSPFDPGLYISENHTCIWFYKNTGSNINPVFEYRTNRFFQEFMLDFGSGAYPVISDLNGDGLPDLLVGNYGYYDTSYYENTILHSEYKARLAYFQNTGSESSPFFSLISDDLADLSKLNQRAMIPSAGDLNGDGKPDILLGQEDGTLVFLPNTGIVEGIPSFGPPQSYYQMIDAGEFSSPQIFDLDKDGLNDLIVGKQNGKLSCYLNKGSASNPIFILFSDSLGRVDVTDHAVSYDGFSTPFFFRDKSQRTMLVVGSEQGEIFFFKNIDQNLEGAFTPSDSLFSVIGISATNFRNGWRSSATLANLSDPLVFDMVTGNFSGGLNYFSKKIHPGVNDLTGINQSKLKVYPNPADQYIIINLTSEHIQPFSDQMMGPFSQFPVIRIYNTLGLKVLEQKACFPANILTSGLPDGIYFLSLGNQRFKLIIHH